MGLALLGILLFLLLRRRNRNTPSPLSSAYDPMMASQNAVSPGASTYSPFPASAGGMQEPYPVTYANQIPTNYIGTSATSGGQVGSNYSGMPQLWTDDILLGLYTICSNCLTSFRLSVYVCFWICTVPWNCIILQYYSVVLKLYAHYLMHFWNLPLSILRTSHTDSARWTYWRWEAWSFPWQIRKYAWQGDKKACNHSRVHLYVSNSQQDLGDVLLSHASSIITEEQNFSAADIKWIFSTTFLHS